VLLLVVVGIIEFAFVFRDSLSVSSSVRVGARVASSGAGAGDAVCESPLPPGATPCVGAEVPQLAQSAADAIQRAGTAMPQDLIDELWVYQANSYGFTTNWTTGTEYTTQDQMLTGTCSLDTRCVRYRWNDASNRFRYAGGGWNSAGIDACIGQADAVGVYMRATHPYFTGFFQTSISLSDRSVMSFEPLPSNICGPNEHP
jgi:hypothetical protein